MQSGQVIGCIDYCTKLIMSVMNTHYTKAYEIMQNVKRTSAGVQDLIAKLQSKLSQSRKL